MHGAMTLLVACIACNTVVGKITLFMYPPGLLPSRGANSIEGWDHQPRAVCTHFKFEVPSIMYVLQDRASGSRAGSAGGRHLGANTPHSGGIGYCPVVST